MRSKKNIKQEIVTLESLKDIIGAYEEIAAIRMRKVKQSVLKNRNFLDGLNDIYQRVLYTYEQQKRKKRFRKENDEHLVTNGKTVSVLISANTGLYGEIIKDTYELFIKNTEGSNTDIIIVGRVGKQLYEARKQKRDYKYFEVSDSGVDTQKISELLKEILTYTNIVVYHGEFVSVLDQKAVKTFVTGKALDIKKGKEKQELKCIIEPSIEEVAIFFEKQILSSIFEQSLYEASLSKFASRMINLDIANENIAEMLDETNFNMLKLSHNEANSKQLERLSGISLWSSS